MTKKKWIRLGVCLLIAWAVVGLQSLATMSNTGIYDELTRPKFSPPGWLFPIVWGILFTLMGVSSFLVYDNEYHENRKRALTVYGISLVVNFFWGIIFFNFQSFTAAFIWLVLLFVWVIILIYEFRKVSELAGNLQIPYAVWVAFAGWLNLYIALRN